MIREYALLADGERGVIVGPRGDFVWMSAPRWDSDAVFATLIGGRGVYAVTPTSPFVWGGYYEAGSLIWRSRWTTSTGVIECREALAFPGDPHRATVLRRIIAKHGLAEVCVTLDLRGGFGQTAVRRLACHDGQWTGRMGNLRARWTGGEAASVTSDGRHGHHLTFTLKLAEGEHHDIVLELSDQDLPAESVDAETAWSDTEYGWQRDVPAFAETIAPADSRHSYAVLRGLTSPGGGMVAAATTSLPERSDRGRNYDYRYAWIRDQCYAGQAVAVNEPLPLLDDAVRFISARLLEDGPQMKPAYTITGARVPDQYHLNLPGYPGAQALVGNHVNEQFQLDVFGESLLLFAAAGRHDHLDGDAWRALQTAAAAIESRWQEPDAGIWEIDNRPWTHSRLICAAGLRAIARLATTTSPPSAARWSALADAIVAQTASTSVSESGCWQRSPGDAAMDAALLLPPIRGALPASDPRTIATLNMFEIELADDFYAYRFRQNPGPLAQSEGAFVLCGFIMALARHQQGNEESALRWFERNRAACGPPGLFSEEFDVNQRQLRGNLPQAFVHALMIECAARLARTWDVDSG